MIVTGNRIESLLTIFAAASLGAIFIILNNSIKPYGFSQIFNQCEPSIVILDETTSILTGETGSAVTIWACSGSRPGKSIRFNDLFTDQSSGDLELPGIDNSNVPACLIFTSGSTGVPRGVMISHDNIYFSTDAIRKRLHYQPDDIIGLFLPLSFDYGLYQIFLTITAGASIFLGQPELTALKLVSYLKKYKITVLPGVPDLFAVMLRLLSIRPQPLPSLKCVTNSGSPLHRSYIKQMRQYVPHLRIFLMYGLTECKRVSILLPEEMDANPDSVGRALDDTEVFTVGDDGVPLPIGETGELVVRGRHLAMGYLNAPAETGQQFRKNFADSHRELYTGDLCRIDRDGFIYFMGRKDCQLKHKGFRINPLEIEKAASNIDGVSEAGMVQAKNPERLFLFITVNSPGVSADGVLKNLRERLEHFKVPERVFLVSKLPKTPNGKLDRKKLAALYLKVSSQNQKKYPGDPDTTLTEGINEE